MDFPWQDNSLPETAPNSDPHIGAVRLVFWTSRQRATKSLL
jgi:hypothetical protein